MQQRKTKAQKYEETRVKLLMIARQEFVTQGYVESATNEIVEKAGVTRGALYYHFKDKQDLFRAVVEDVAREIVELIEARATAATSQWEALVAGCHAFMDACSCPDVQRLLLLDAPAVLGWAEWRRIDYGIGSLYEGLKRCQEAREIGPVSVTAFTHLIAGALNEAALAIVEAEEPVTTHEEMLKAINHLLSCLRQNP